MTEELNPGRAEDIEKLISRMAEGDKEALAAFYQETKGPVYALAMSVLGERHGAEDIMQETYIKAYGAAASYEPRGNPMAWLLTIARNLALMRIRSQKGRDDELKEDLSGPGFETGSVDRLTLKGALDTLGEEERQVVVLHAVAGFTHKEAAAMLNMPLSTALSKYHRALAKLRKHLGGEGR